MEIRELLERIKKAKAIYKKIEEEHKRQVGNCFKCEMSRLLDNIDSFLSSIQDAEKIKKIIIDWFIALEKKQSIEQIAEVDKKGLWGADLKSVTFEEVANGLSQAIAKEIGGEE